MPLDVDPAGREILALKEAAVWAGKRVLEIGCGDGRLTLRLAALGPKHIEALDADAGRIRQARKNLPAPYKRHVTYHVGSALRLRHPEETFDLVLFSWAL
jgi:ubiquinone/menaquinone biosynthesis C-methylase UbiE